jgi:hypothetical protein
MLNTRKLPVDPKCTNPMFRNGVLISKYPIMPSVNWIKTYS